MDNASVFMAEAFFIEVLLKSDTGLRCVGNLLQNPPRLTKTLNEYWEVPGTFGDAINERK